MPIKKVEITEKMWWDRYEHPLSDSQFVAAFCEHVFLSTKDRSLSTVRDRAYRFIRNFMAPDLEKQLTDYRKAHSHDPV